MSLPMRFSTHLRCEQHARTQIPFGSAFRSSNGPARQPPAVRCKATGFQGKPASAKVAIETGTKEFEKKNYSDAMDLYMTAMDMNPSEDEARAAMYNLACVHTQQGRWQDAVDAITSAVNDHNLKISVANADPDLRKLRERREWLDAQDTLKGVMASETRYNLRAEAKAPFRLTRTAIAGALALGAGVGLLIISTRLIAAVKGGEGVPDLQETLQNFFINLTAFGVLVFVFSRDVKSQSTDAQVIASEEELGRLQIDLGKDRVVPLTRFRGTIRPLILAGNKTFLKNCNVQVKRYKDELQARGISLLPVLLTDADPDEALRALKAEFRKSDKSKGFGGKKEVEEDLTPITQEDKRWQLTPFDTDEWSAWLLAQKKSKGLDAPSQPSGLFVQVQLDGSVKSSGQGIPSFPAIIKEFPRLDDFRTQFIDGVGPAEEM